MRRKLFAGLAIVIALVLNSLSVYAAGDLQVTNEDIVGRWMVTDGRLYSYRVSFDEDGICHILCQTDKKKMEFCIGLDGEVLLEEFSLNVPETEKFSVLRTGNVIFYYVADESCYNYKGLLCLNGEESDKAYVVSLSSELFISDDKFISLEDQEKAEYDLVENVICYLREEEIQGFEVVDYGDDFFICKNVDRWGKKEDSEKEMKIFIRKNVLESEEEAE